MAARRKKWSPPSIEDKKSLQVIDGMVKKLQVVALETAGQVASEAWLRAYWRAHPHRLVDFVTARVPTVLAGPGVDGEHKVTVLHAIRRSVLDGLPAPVEVSGERLPVDGVEVVVGGQRE